MSARDPLTELLEAEAATPGPDAATKDRVRARVVAALGGPGGGGGGDGGGDGGESPPIDDAPPSLADPSPVAASGGAAGWAGAAVAAVAAAGLVTWFALRSRVPVDHEKEEQVEEVGEVVTVATPPATVTTGNADGPLPVERVEDGEQLATTKVEAASVVEKPESEPEPGRKPKPKAVAKPARAPVAEAAPTHEPAGFAAEYALVQGMWADLKAQRFAAAMAKVAQHEREFASGQLVQEREAARVQALCGQGKVEAGRAAKARFFKRFANSSHRAKLEGACEP